MKKLPSIRFLSFSILILFSYFGKAQTVIGKKFEGEVNHSCSKGTVEICDNITYCSLYFYKDKVEASYRYNNNCWSKEGKHTISERKDTVSKTYQWKKKGNKILIKGLPTNHEEFIFKENKLIVFYYSKWIEYLEIK